MSDLKARIRKAARARRAQLSEAERRRASSAVTHAVLGLWDLEGAKTVLAYVATGDEVDTEPIIDALGIRGVRVALPRVDEPIGLAIHLVSDKAELVSGPFGVLEPALATPRVEPAHIDAAIVPGVAFDPACNRIGYGGGFYDRLLPLLRGDCPRIGLAFDEQMMDALPVEPHDAALDLVVTPERVWRAEEPT